MHAMNHRQRVVLVVALGAAASIAAVLVNRLLSDGDGGWFAYAPNTGAVFAPDRTSAIWREALVWFTATAVWAGVSLWLLRSSGGSED
jgi:hypothetical protein